MQGDDNDRDATGTTNGHGSATARMILDTALNLFYVYGARSTTVRQLTNACGLTTGALYNYFDSKEELLYTIISDRHLWVEARLAAAQESAKGDPKAEYFAMVDEFLRLHVPGHKAVHVANRDYGVLTGKRRAEVVAARRRIRDRFAQVLSAGQDAGAFDLPGGGDEISAKIMAIDIIEMCISINVWYIEGRTVSTEELIRRYQLIAMRLVLPHPAADAELEQSRLQGLVGAVDNSKYSPRVPRSPRRGVWESGQ